MRFLPLLLLVFLLLTTAPTVRAQKLPVAIPDPVLYGQVTATDLDPTHFAADTGAAAVVLADYGRTSIVDGSINDSEYLVRFERVRRVKILTEKGLEEATARVRLHRLANGHQDQVKDLRGASYHLDGAGQLVRTEARSSDIVSATLVDGVTERRLTLPNVRVGSVVEFAYTTFTERFFTLPEWWFQEDVPVRLSEYRVQIPELFDYAAQLQGFAPLAVTEQTVGTQVMNTGQGARPIKVTNIRWVARGLPAFHPEAFITTPADYKTHVRFQLRGTAFPGVGYHNYAGTWKAVAGEMLLAPTFGGVLGSVGNLQKPLATLKSQMPDPEARAAAVVRLVRGALTFDGDDDVFTTGAVRAALDRRRGNAAEINLLLVSALRAAGLGAEPVILSTRDHGTVPGDEPVLAAYNFVLALAQLPATKTTEARELLLDATDSHAAFGMLPERCLGTRGRLIVADEKAQRWLDLKATQQYATFTTGTLALDAHGATTGELRREFSGYSGQRVRQAATTLDGAALLKRYARVGPDVHLPKHTFTQPDDLAQPVALELTVAADGPEPAGTKAPERLYFTLKDFGGLTENLFRQPERQYPVDLGAPLSQTVMLDVALPPGYALESVPATLLLRTPDGAAITQFACTPADDGRSVQITSRLNLNRAYYAPEQYASLRTIYERLLGKHAEALVFKKQ